MKTLADLHILLMQVRRDRQTLDEEREAFAEFSGLRLEQIDSLRIFETPVFDPSMVDEYDALFVGGSSDDDDALIRPDKPRFAVNAMRMLSYCYEHKVPVFASCFGFQAAVVALGGDLIHDVSRKEFGTLLVDVTEEGKEDVLFKDTPSRFRAIIGHEKLAAWLPEGAITLAKTEVCPHHAFTFPDRPFYAFQYHPELTVEQLTLWLTRYEDRYFKEDGELASILQDAEETPYANILLGKYMERVLLPALNGSV